jgi:hypothetical protein
MFDSRKQINCCKKYRDTVSYGKYRFQILAFRPFILNDLIVIFLISSTIFIIFRSTMLQYFQSVNPIIPRCIQPAADNAVKYSRVNFITKFYSTPNCTNTGYITVRDVTLPTLLTVIDILMLSALSVRMIFIRASSLSKSVSFSEQPTLH